MRQSINLNLIPSIAENESLLKKEIADHTGYKEGEISGFLIKKKSIDARGRQVYITLNIDAYINEPFFSRALQRIDFQSVERAENEVIIVGAGPAGLFAALMLIEKGIRPIIFERGKNVRARRRDLSVLNKDGIINPESNYCFGEGGAGTYSDGKLYTRSNKRGDIHRILNLFVQFGADEKILYDAHPHIGTNKLPQIITAMREQIEACGGKILFEKKLVDLEIVDHNITRLIMANGDRVDAKAVILATGHSARDIYEMLWRKDITIHAKPFALGVRVEHPQQLIDSIQYHQLSRDEFLPPASYSLVQQVGGRGVFSFCMCPGGIIAPASTSPGELVVNGWSPSKRNNPFANSGMVVAVEEKDFPKNKNIPPPLSGLYFQSTVEQKAFEFGGGRFVAPAQRMTDMIDNKISNDLPSCSYLPGVNAVSLKEILPPFVHQNLCDAFRAFGKKMKGYVTSEAIVVATESRTSSPVRIPRDPEKLHHPSIKNLFPCSEGAGYAGGIISAAMDGENVAGKIAAALVR
ncbi:MAG: FAD-dependent protein [Chitinophagaceae bacterium]